jgi:hypothetical protein
MSWLSFFSCSSTSSTKTKTKRMNPDWTLFPQQFIVETYTVFQRTRRITLSLAVCEPNGVTPNQYFGSGISHFNNEYSRTFFNIHVDTSSNSLDLLKINLEKDSTTKYTAVFQSYNQEENLWLFHIQGFFIDSPHKKIDGVLKIRSIE